MKFAITNRTKYQTRHLRAITTRAYKVAATCAGPRRTAEHARFVPCIRVTFARANHRGPAGVTGHAYYNSGTAHVGLGDDANRREVARVTAHEFGHCLGLHHSDMSGGPLMGGNTERNFGWVDTLPLEKTAPKKKVPRADLTYARVCARLKKWESRAKRAATAIKKLRRTKTRYEWLNKAAAASVPSSAG